MNDQTQTQPKELSEPEINAQHMRAMSMRRARAERPALNAPRSPDAFPDKNADIPPGPPDGDGSGPVNTPITWPQLIGGWMSDYTDPAVMLAFLGVIYAWIGNTGPITWRLAATAVLGAVIAAEQAILRKHGGDGLARRLKAMGQIRKDSH